MNSSFNLSSLSDYSPVDWSSSTFQVTELFEEEEAAENNIVEAKNKRKSKLKVNESAEPKKAKTKIEFYVQPQIFSRRIDATSRRLSAYVEKLEVEPHVSILFFEEDDLFPMENELQSLPSVEMHDENETTKKANAIVEQPKTELAANILKEKLNKTKQKSVEDSKKALFKDETLKKPKAKIDSQAGTLKKTKAKVDQLPVTPVPTAVTPPVTETALVRLNNGKLVRVPLDVIRKHQASVLQARQIATTNIQPQVIPQPMGGRSQTLSHVLQQIGIQPSTANVLPTPNQTLLVPQPQAIRPSNQIIIQPSNRKVVCVKGYPDPRTLQQNPNSTITGLQTVKLSDGLSSIVPLSTSAQSTSSIPQSVLSLIRNPTSMSGGTSNLTILPGGSMMTPVQLNNEPKQFYVVSPTKSTQGGGHSSSSGSPRTLVIQPINPGAGNVTNQVVTSSSPSVTSIAGHKILTLDGPGGLKIATPPSFLKHS